MKRHEALIPFSQQHHHALVLVLKIQQDRWLDLDWEHEMQLLLSHFDEEETLFQNCWLPLNQTELQQQFEAEHEQLRLMAIKRPVSSEEAKTFAMLLKQHIRFEEQILFTAFQTANIF